MREQLITPILVGLITLLMLLLNWCFPLARFLHFPLNMAGILFLIPGFGLSMAGVSRISRAATTLHTFKQPLTLITDGPYHYSRNPIYLGLLLCLIGLWIGLGSLSSSIGILIFFMVSNTWYIPYEERMLTDQFGMAYLSYRAQVRRWF